MSKVWIFGEYVKQVDEDCIWYLNGVFDDPEKAELACKTENDFVAALEINDIPSQGKEHFKECHYPFIEGFKYIDAPTE